MPFFKTSYDTTIGKIFNQNKLEFPLKEALVSGMLPNRNLGVEQIDQKKAVFVLGGSPNEINVPSFIHPYLIENFKGIDYLVTDLRLFRTKSDEFMSDREFEASVKNKTEYSLVKSRAALNLLWLSPEIKRLRARFVFAGSVFAAWLSQAISRAYALDFQDQLRIMAVSIYYYFSLFTENKRLEGDELELAVIHTIKATKFPSVEVYKLFENIEQIDGIESYCEEVKKAIENVRLKDFNLAMLLTLIRNSWYGTNSKELLSVALEHPPTWISIVFATMTERTYRSSSLYKLIETQARRSNGDEFKMNYLDLIQDAITVVESADNELVIRDFE